MGGRPRSPLGIKRLNDGEQWVPWKECLHAGEERLPAGHFLFGGKLGLRETRLVDHAPSLENSPRLVAKFHQIIKSAFPKDAELLDFIGAARTQGRHQFADGTAQREIIDHIPTVPATQAPTKAVISSATGPAAGTLQATGDADHATSFDWFRKGPGAAAFVKVADDVIQRTYHATGLAAGSYEIKLVGRNSRGPGPASDVSTVNVT